jgi:UDP-glucuronate 4-epimerase
VPLNDFIAALERRLGRAAIREELPLQAGDVPETWADCSGLEADFGYRPTTPVSQGIDQFVDWYLAWQGREQVS